MLRTPSPSLSSSPRSLLLVAALALSLGACSKKSGAGGQTTGSTAQGPETTGQTAGEATGQTAGQTAGQTTGETTGAAKAPEPPAQPAVPVRHARVEPKRVLIEIKDLSEDERKAMEKVAERFPDQYEEGKHIPATEAAVPARYRDQKDHLIITPKGAYKATLQGFLAGHGASEFHFQLVLTRPAEVTDERTVGLSVPGTDATKAPTITLPAPVKLDTEEGGALLSGLSGQAQAAYAEQPKEEGVERPAAFPKLRDEDVTFIKGSFPKPITTLAFVRIKPEKDKGLHEGQFSAFGLLNEGGTVVKWLAPPRHDLNAQEIIGLVRHPGQTLDHVLYHDAYYEGSFTLLLSPKPDGSGFGDPVMIEGDGA